MLNELILKFIRLYTFYSPIRKGKYRLYEFALNRVKKLPENLVVKTTDGRRIATRLSNKMFDTVFFLGEFERANTNIVSELIEKDFVCLDVGANFGWFSTLFIKLGAKEVYSFEPVPPVFEDLKKNFELAGKPENFKIQNIALGNEEKSIELHLFEGLPDGHASISAQGKEKYEKFEAKMLKLDTVLEEKNIEKVDFVKVDIEGAELLFLKGAEKLFKQTKPPIFLIEMALETSKHFGYTPQDLIEFIGRRAAYDFYAVDDFKVKLTKIESFAKDDIGANVLCLPADFQTEKIRKFIINER